ncbi:MAG: hypothetical protein ACRD0B_06265, partial [Acidimicrobiales bacterium]
TSFDGLSCPAARACVAVASVDQSLESRLFLQHAGSWISLVPPLPPGAPPESQAGVSLGAPACTSPGDCLVAGSYQDSSATTQPLLLDESAGVWSQLPVPFPSPASGGALAGVACVPATGSESPRCTAVGYFDPEPPPGGVSGSPSGGEPAPEPMAVAEMGGSLAAEAVAPPAGVAPGSASTLIGVTCSGDDCLATGASLASSTAAPSSWLWDAAGGSTGATLVPVPASSPAGSRAELDAISCTPAGTNCVAAGAAVSAAASAGLVVTDRAGTLSSETVAPSGAVASTSGLVADLDAVSCSEGQCEAVGGSFNSFGDLVPVEATVDPTTGAVSAGRPVVPGGGLRDDLASLDDVSCPAAGTCFAVGSVVNASDGYDNGALVDVLSGGRWRARLVRLPRDAQAHGTENLSAISCVSAAYCVAAGIYDDTAGDQDGLLVTESKGRLQARRAPLPAGTEPGADPTLDAVACIPGGGCLVTGEYGPEQIYGGGTGLIEAERGGRWTASKAPDPPGAGEPARETIWAVSCGSWGRCAAGGTDFEASGEELGMLLTESGARWRAAWAPLPPELAGTENAQVDQIACAR